jgi:hypothetical protein
MLDKTLPPVVGTGVEYARKALFSATWNRALTKIAPAKRRIVIDTPAIRQGGASLAKLRART